MAKSGRVPPRTRALPALAVFCSGRGTNLQAILDATRRQRLRARVALVISDQPAAAALRRARRAGVDAVVVERRAYPSRSAFERAITGVLKARHIRLICLAGFMRLLSPSFVRRYTRRILNVHPALLPAFPGAHAIRDALAWGAKVTGVTVHFVDEHVDHGPIILQEAVRVAPHDTEASLLRKVHRVEHRLYPEAIGLVLDGRVRLRGRAVRVVRR